MSNITVILERLHAGDAEAIGVLFEHVYQELLGMARGQVQGDGYTGALSPTELVHEAYLRLFNGFKPTVVDRGYFFAAAAQAMRRVRVDHYRAMKAEKRGGHNKQVELESGLAQIGEDDLDLVALDEALNRLAQVDAIKAKLVELRFFASLKMNRVAEVLDISVSTAERYWKYARAWLLAELRKERSQPS